MEIKKHSPRTDHSIRGLVAATLLTLVAGALAVAPSAQADDFSTCTAKVDRVEAKHNKQLRACQRRAVAHPSYNLSRCAAKADRSLLRAEGRLVCARFGVPPPLPPFSAARPGYITKVVTVPANAESVDTGLQFQNDYCEVAISATGKWSNRGLPTLNPYGFYGYQLPGTVDPDADLGTLLAMWKLGSDEPALDVIGTFGLVVTGERAGEINFHHFGELLLAMNDIPGTYGDNQGEVQVAVSFRSDCQVTAAQTVRAIDEWTDTGLIFADGQDYDIRYVSGRWANSSPANPIYLDGAGFVGYHLDGRRFAGADFAALIGEFDIAMFPVGNHGSGSAQNDGRLQLGMNDISGTFGDNLGALDVVIRFYQQGPIIP